MAISEKEFRDLSNNVSRINGVLAVGGGIATLLISGGFVWCLHLSSQVAEIRQALKDKGTEIVARLKSPKSPEELQANLTTVTAQIETARVEGKPPNASKTETLANTLSQVVRDNPQLPIAWNAAVQLVNYRSQPLATNVASLPNCLNLPLNRGPSVEMQVPGADGLPAHVPIAKDENPVIVGSMVVAQNCRLDLDDDGTYASSNTAKDFEDAKRRKANINYFILEVSNAYITYSGGKLIPINEIRFRNCAFDIKPSPDVPDKRRQSITQQLLEANSTEGKIQLPVG